MIDLIQTHWTKLFLTLSALPYVTLAGYDFWLHDTSRITPKSEKVLHTMILSGLAVFITTAILGFQLIAKVSLTLVIPSMILDEVFYHRSLDKKEKTIHLIAGVALAFFIGSWAWTIY